jgi:putative transcriptional regulator
MSSEASINRIAAARTSQRKLAATLDVHQQTVGYLQRGGYSPGLYLALRNRRTLEVPLELIFSTKPPA